MNANDPLYVVALNYRAYLEWCQRKRYAPHNGGVIYVRDARRLLGVRDVRILFLTGWEGRQDAREVYNRAMIVGRRPS